jgi:hypothetical protein
MCLLVASRRARGLGTAIRVWCCGAVPRSPAAEPHPLRRHCDCCSGTAAADDTHAVSSALQLHDAHRRVQPLRRCSQRVSLPPRLLLYGTVPAGVMSQVDAQSQLLPSRLSCGRKAPGTSTSRVEVTGLPRVAERGRHLLISHRPLISPTHAKHIPH